VRRIVHCLARPRLAAAVGLAAVLAWAACARVRPLEGGPADVAPPVLVRVQPPDSSVSLPPQPRFVLEFDEPVAAAAVRRGIRFEPPRRLREITVKGRRVTIELADSLPPDTTVTLVLGEAVQDLPGRDNKLAQEITLVYATAERIRGGAATGRVTARGKPDTRVAVAWQPVPPDTGAAARNRIGRVAAATSEGLFRLAALPVGRRFRLLAFVDANDDLRPDSDELQAVYPETLVLADGEVRRGLAWNIVDANELGEWVGVALNGSGVAGAAAVAVRRLRDDGVGRSGAGADTTAGRPTRARADTLRPRALPVAVRDSSTWGAAYARLEPEGFVPGEWTVVYASPRGDYSLRVAPGRVVWLAFVDALRDSVPGLYVGADSTRLDWEPLVVGDTVVVAPGERQRRRAIEIR